MLREALRPTPSNCIRVWQRSAAMWRQSCVPRLCRATRDLLVPSVFVASGHRAAQALQPFFTRSLGCSMRALRVQTYCTSTGLDPPLLRPRVVVTHHGPDYEREKWGSFGRWVLRLGERFGMRKSHARISISKAISDRVLAQYGRESYLIPNGVVPAKPRTDVKHVQRFGLEPGRYFLQVSRMVPEKRQLDLIRAFMFAQPKGWKLALVGSLDDDSYSQKVSAEGREAGVVLTGYLTGEPLQQMYSYAGAFVLPSSHEGLPIALLEALSYGLPVLASDIPANMELGLDTASYFPLGDTVALADRLTQLAEVPLNEDARAARRRWTSQRYDWDRIAEQTLEVYRGLSRHSD